MLKWLIHVYRPQLPNECVQTLFFNEAAGHARKVWSGDEATNEPTIYRYLCFHFRFHFYREALLERIKEIEGDETFFPRLDLCYSSYSYVAIRQDNISLF